MSKTRGAKRRRQVEQRPPALKWLMAAAVAVLAAAIVYFFVVYRNGSGNTGGSPVSSSPVAPTIPLPVTTPEGEPVTMEVATAVMVTVELDFGGKPPTIAEALGDIERRYEPADRVGRTFAILDAYGESTPDGKLHMSMHVSSEKPGGGSLIFKRTGKVLWQSRINPSAKPVPQKSLLIQVGGGSGGKSFTVDGSNNPRSVLDARAKESGILVRDAWRDGEEREVTFIYSACGCPVKAMVKRVGDRTVRTKDLPVMFPDDPAAVGTIARLMGW